MALGRTNAETAELELGKSIVEQLEPRMSQAEAGAKLGISREAVRRIERRALAKIAARLLEYANNI
jgi:predicted DNA-binding protein (UPF0251 family)